jgi:tetratricopeptide (TPR) repeat protein
MLVGLAMALCLVPICAYADATVVLEPQRQLQFAEDYFQKGEYYRAIGEYERLVHFFPEAAEVEEASYKIGLSYLRGGQYAEAMQAFQGVIRRYVDSRHAVRSYFGIAEAQVRLKKYDEAHITLEHLIRMAPDRDVIDEAYYRCGWVYLEQGLRKEARECFDRISSSNRERYEIEKLMKEMDKEAHLRRKNPTTAGLLAVIPGAGHVYTERYRDGLVSFLVNGAMIFATYQAFRHEQYALGGILTVVELGFYSGNIYGAVNSAHKFNQDQENRFLQHLREHAKITLGLQQPQEGGAIVLSCNIPF